MMEEEDVYFDWQVRRDLVEETLVEEQEEGELAHLSWVRNYDRPLPQVASTLSTVLRNNV